MMQLALLLLFVGPPPTNALTLPSQIQSSIMEVAWRFGRPDAIGARIALLQMPKRDLLRNLTDLLHDLGLDRVEAEADHNAFADEYEVAIGAINKTIVDATAELNKAQQALRELDDDLRVMQDALGDMQADVDETLSESRLFASAANAIVAAHADQQQDYQNRLQGLGLALQMLDQLSETETIQMAIARVRGLFHNNDNADLVAECVGDLHEATLQPNGLQWTWLRLVEKRQLLTAEAIGAETRFKRTMDTYGALIADYSADHDAVRIEIEMLEADRRQLLEQRAERQAEVDAIQISLQTSRTTMKSLIRAMVKERLEFDVQVSDRRADLDNLEAAVMQINESVDGDRWPGLCRIGAPDCRRCQYDDHCPNDEQICSEDGLCIIEANRESLY